MRSRRFGIVVAAGLAAALFAAPGARAEDGKPPAAQPPGNGGPLVWVDGFAAGKAAALQKNKTLMLVYVPSDKLPPETVAEFEKCFTDPRIGEVTARCQPVRILVGDVRTPEQKAFLKRYEVQALPGIFIMNRDGHFLIRNMRRNVDSVLRSLTKAEDDEKMFTLLAKKQDAFSKTEYRRQLGVRMAWEELLLIVTPEATDKPSPENLTEAARAFQHLGRADEEKAMYATAVEQFPKDPGAARWRMRLATMHLDAVDDQSDEFCKGMVKAMMPLAEALAREGDKLGAAESHLVIGNYLARAKERPVPEDERNVALDEALREYDVVVSLAPDKPCAAKALMGKATIAWYRYDYAKCKELCQKVVAEFAETCPGESWAAKGVIKDCDKRMSQPEK